MRTPKSTFQVATAFFILLLTSKIFGEVYVNKDNDGKLNFRNVPCTETQEKEDCRKVITEKDPLPADTVIEPAHWNESIISARQWKWKQDINGDGKITISDVYGWVKWLFFYPGDWLIYVLLKERWRVAEFLELTTNSYGGNLSLFISTLAWTLLCAALAVLDGISYALGGSTVDASTNDDPPGLHDFKGLEFFSRPEEVQQEGENEEKSNERNRSELKR